MSSEEEASLRARLGKIADPAALIAALENARPSPTVASQWIQPFVALLAMSPELLRAEREVLLRRGARVFGCTVQSLRDDLRLARLHQAVRAIRQAERDEIAILERMWRMT
jgi:hypothetical protein